MLDERRGFARIRVNNPFGGDVLSQNQVQFALKFSNLLIPPKFFFQIYFLKIRKKFPQKKKQLSTLLAQSKPHPKRESIWINVGSGLHFTA
jgi:hypothetical protein